MGMVVSRVLFSTLSQPERLGLRQAPGQAKGVVLGGEG